MPANCTVSCVHTVCMALLDLNKHLSTLAGHLNPVKSNGLMHSIELYMEISHRSLLLEHYKRMLNKNNKIKMDSLCPEWYQSAAYCHKIINISQRALSLIHFCVCRTTGMYLRPNVFYKLQSDPRV